MQDKTALTRQCALDCLVSLVSTGSATVQQVKVLEQPILATNIYCKYYSIDKHHAIRIMQHSFDSQYMSILLDECVCVCVISDVYYIVIVPLSHKQNGTRDFQPATVLQLKPSLQRIYDAARTASTSAATATDTANTDTDTAAAADSSSAAAAAATDGTATAAATKDTAAASASSSSVLPTIRKPSATSSTLTKRSGATSSTGMHHRANSSKLSTAAAAAASTVPVTASATSGGRAPSSVCSSHDETADDTTVLMTRNSGKAKRADADKRSKWTVQLSLEDQRDRDALIESLKSQWSPHLNSNAVQKLFPTVRTGSMECGLDGAIMLSEQLIHSCTEAYVDCSDLVLKWITLRLTEKENVAALVKLFELLDATLKLVSYSIYTYVCT
jgi:hypothetical protein